MKVAIIGYGKMGRAIEAILLKKGYVISYRIDQDNKDDIMLINTDNTDVCIEFTGPETALFNVTTLLKKGLPVVCGSTGWYTDLSAMKDLVEQYGAALVVASNFSIGVNLFFEAAAYLALLMNAYPEYNVSIEETHHTEKKDAPSGTAITLAHEVIPHLPNYDGYVLHVNEAKKITIHAHREPNVPGTHELNFENEIDKIQLIHTAYTRTGFAQGAVVAAEFLKGKKGFYTIREILKLNTVKPE